MLTPLGRTTILALSVVANIAGQTNWIVRSNAGPTPRCTAIAYDRSRDVVVLYGGFGPPTLGDTWEWDGGSWQRFVGGSPIARSGHALAYDVARQVVTLFGGLTNDLASLNDTWFFDGRAWAHRSNTGPQPRSAHAMAYDVARERIVLFGGVDRTGLTPLRDTWEWDGQAWQERRPATRPRARGAAAMAYDRARQRTVLFGGWNNNVFQPGYGDTWEWDGQDWLLLQPSVRPQGRWFHAMTYDEARRRVVVFGGVFSLAAFPNDETWEWDGNEWTRRFPQTSPSGRCSAATTFDWRREVVVLFGGVDTDPRGGTRPRNDTWEYSSQSPAAYTTFGQSCAGSRTTPILAPRDGDRPWLDDTMGVELRDLPSGQPVVMLTGFSDTSWGNIRLPLPLDALGMLGCFLYTPPEITTSLANPQGLALWTVPLPDDASLIGLCFFNQGFVLDPGANALDVVATNAGAGTIGAR